MSGAASDPGNGAKEDKVSQEPTAEADKDTNAEIIDKNATSEEKPATSITGKADGAAAETNEDSATSADSVGGTLKRKGAENDQQDPEQPAVSCPGGF